MLKALVWKEYREQLPVALAGMAISLVLPFVVLSMVAATISSADPMDMADVLRFIMAVMVLPIFAAAMGATTFAGDSGKASLGFLLSRPVARGWIWLAKTATGAIAVLVVVGISWLVTKIFDYLVAGPSMRPSLSAGPLSSSETFALANVVVVIGLAFALSALFAGLFDRSLTAAGAGLVVGWGLVILTNAYWQAMGVFGRDLDAHVVFTQLGLVTTSILLVSLYAFARGDLLERRAYRRRLALGGSVIVLIWFLGTAGLLYAETRLDPSYARLSSPRLAPAGEGVAVRANRANRRAPRVWLIRFDGELVELTSRWASFRGFTDDGGSILYTAQQGWFGLPSRTRELRAVNLDGTDDRFIAGDISDYIYTWAPSPDGRLRARSEYEQSRYMDRRHRVFVVTSADGTEVNRLDMREIVNPYDWAWREDSSGIVFSRRGNLSLVQYEPTSGELTTFFVPPGNRDRYRYSRWSALPDPLGNQVRLSRAEVSEESGEVRWAVDDIDFETGQVATVFEIEGSTAPGRDERFCDEYVRLSRDRRRFFYTTCLSYRHAPDRTWKVNLHVVDLVTGEDRLWTTVEGSFFRPRMGPGDDRIIVQFNQPLVDRERDLRPPALWEWRTMHAIVQPDGTLLELEDGWEPIDWIDRGRALAAYHPEVFTESVSYGSIRRSRYSSFTRLAIVDVLTGEMEVFFP